MPQLMHHDEQVEDEEDLEGDEKGVGHVGEHGGMGAP
jgi:hypothetical protein